MSSLLLLAACLALGGIVARWGTHPEALARHLNWWVINIALPSLVLEIIPRLQFEWSLWYLPVAMWLVFLMSWGLFAFIGRQLRWPRATIGALILTAGLSNTSFVGFPLIEALRGKDALKYAALADQLGCFLAVAIGGSLVAAIYSDGKAVPRVIFRKVMRFPPFIAMLIAIAAGLGGGWPSLVDEVLARLGSTLAPLALFSVGLQLQLRFDVRRLPAASIGLASKLLLAPLLIYALGSGLRIHAPVLDIAVLQAGMAPMMTGAILAQQHDLDPPLANFVLGAGIVLSMLTAPAWNAVLYL